MTVSVQYLSGRSVEGRQKARASSAGPVAHPPRDAAHGGSGRVVSCADRSTMRPASLTPPVGMWLRIKVGLVVALALVGVGVSVAEFATWSPVDSAGSHTLGDPAWAHVDGRG